VTQPISTADLCDEHADELEVCETEFQAYGAIPSFKGLISTIQCFEDNSRVKEAVEGPGDGRVLVIDGGGSRRRALLGDKLAAAAVSQRLGRRDHPRLRARFARAQHDGDRHPGTRCHPAAQRQARQG
jgi:regulator of RNase E activity RraA